MSTNFKLLRKINLVKVLNCSGTYVHSTTERPVRRKGGESARDFPRASQRARKMCAGVFFSSCCCVAFVCMLLIEERVLLLFCYFCCCCLSCILESFGGLGGRV